MRGAVRKTAGCHGGAAPATDPTGAGAPVAGRGTPWDLSGRPLPRDEPWRVALVGAPNVGKSALFHRLTGRYATVSNYPGTSVNVVRGRGRLAGNAAEVMDTPGLYSLLPTTEDERVAREIVLRGEPDVLIHVVEARSLERSLPLTLQLAELGRPLVVALNMVDELDRLGLRVDVELLASRLGVEVVPVVAVSGRGVEALARAVARSLCPLPPPTPDWGGEVEEGVRRVERLLTGSYGVRTRGVASLLLQGDTSAVRLVSERESDGGRAVIDEATRAAAGLEGGALYRTAVARRRRAGELARDVLVAERRPAQRNRERLGRWLARPATGLPVLAVVLYLGLYRFVGGFGAGTLVDGLEGTLFEGLLNPYLESLFLGIPWEWLRNLWVGDYGLLTLGVRYAVAIVLPIVGTFFLFFSVLEDSGYFPRLALLVDRTFRRVGLNGRAVIPLVLGFACDTMATMVTRTLESRRERLLATALLALAVPCSAQLGVILAVLAGHPMAMTVWTASVAGTFLLVGALGARLLPGRPSSFHMELPPMRWPRPANVLRKSWTRVRWYFLEVLPLFLLASVLLWVGELTGLLRVALGGLGPVVGALGLPPETASVFLFGFFRRDYGAAGLFDQAAAGLLDPVGLTVAAVTLTLFVPCVAQFLMMWKERGPGAATGIFVFATLFAFSAGFTLNLVLRGMGL